MRTLALLLAGSFVLACGGEKPPKSPESTTAAETESGQVDMPAPPAKDGQETTEGATAKEGAGAAGGMLAVAAMKFVPAKAAKGAKPLEVKADGTVTVDGKTVAKIAGDELQDESGVTMVTVGVDGSLVGSALKPGFKFEGDELTAEGGAKLAVDDEGTVTMTRDGKSETLGKFDGVGKAKRAALLVAVVMLAPKAGEGPAAVKSAPKKK